MPNRLMRSALPGRCLASLTLFLAALLPAAPASAAPPAFLTFESGPVRPIAMSPDRKRLFVTNTPNNTLDIFNITAAGLAMAARVPVGMEPVAVVALSDTEVWVVNHLSDSISIVSLAGMPRVTRTLLVGDEPRDIVLAGSPRRAFITTAHRGQHRTHPSLQGVPGAGDPQLTTPGVARADVWVFDPANLGTGLGGQPLRIMSFFADTPRALAVSPDGNKVYVAAFKSGNQTTIIPDALVCYGFNPSQPCTVGKVKSPGGHPGPKTNAAGNPAPETSLIVKFNNARQAWEDELGRNWNDAVRFSLPDKDVFAVDANTLTQSAAFPHVGTTLFNMVTNPVTGTLYVSNTDANNLFRFTGDGKFAGQSLKGNLAKSRITVISGSNVAPRHLNKHIDYSKPSTDPAFDPTTKNHSLASPLDMAVTSDGKTLFVTAFGSSRIGVFSTAELETDTFDPRAASANYITVSGGGPSGIVLDEPRGRMYVTTRFDNAVKVIDLASRAEISAMTLPNPEPAHVVEGRPVLYDANQASANGENACVSCHPFGDMDELAWDLGNPDDVVTTSPLNRFLGSDLIIRFGRRRFGPETPVNGSDKAADLHPMKGPMATQTLRGMRNGGALHWRGDRSTGPFGTSALDSTISFKNFAGSFKALLGNQKAATEAEIERFARFQLDVQPPPNPVRNLDNSLTPAQQRGAAFYKGPRPSAGVDLSAGLGGLLGGGGGGGLGDLLGDGGGGGLGDLLGNIPGLGDLIGGGGGGLGNLDLSRLVGQTTFTCEGCHKLNPAQGFFGTGGDASFEALPQIFKIPQLRNMYQKVGMFGLPEMQGITTKENTTFMGDQIRGFGFGFDGAMDTMFRFFNAGVFAPQATVGFPQQNPDATRRDVVEFMLAFDNDLAPIVGQQVTLTADNAAAAGPRIDLLIQRAQTPFISKELDVNTRECDLTARMVEGGALRGYLFDAASRLFAGADGTRRSDAELRALAAVEGQEITYTCVPPGSGARVAYNQSVVVAGGGSSLPSADAGTPDGDGEAGGGAMGLAWLVALWIAVAVARRGARSGALPEGEGAGLV
jgi:DNA-binding beta-propeller fold protein YncE